MLYFICILQLYRLNCSLTSESICFLWLWLLSVDTVDCELIVVYGQWPPTYGLVPLLGTNGSIQSTTISVRAKLKVKVFSLD